MLGTCILFLITTILIEFELFGQATLLLVVSVIAAQFLNIYNVFAFVSANLTNILYVAVFYVAIGVAWSFIKWFSFLRNYRNKFRDLKGQFLKSIDRNDCVLDQELTNKFKRFINSYTLFSPIKFRLDYTTSHQEMWVIEKPNASSKKSVIVGWMAFWPCSLLATMINDPVRKMFKWIFNFLKNSYQNISDIVFKNDVELK